MGREGTLCARVQLRAQCRAQLSDDGSLVSSSTFSDTKGNLLSPVTEKVWGGFQAQLDSGAQMMTSVFYHFYFSLCCLHSQRLLVLLFSAGPGPKLYWVGVGHVTIRGPVTVARIDQSWFLEPVWVCQPLRTPQMAMWKWGFP